MNAIGLDLGTTTLSALVLDGESGKVLCAKSVPHQGGLEPDVPGGRLQDPVKIGDMALALAGQLAAEWGNIGALGLTGQMHGIVYLDQGGRAVSPLYTWQDGRGGLPLDGGTWAQALSQASGYPMATGFGLTTHYWLEKNRLTPPGAASLATLADYVGLRLTGRTRPLMHVSNAASLGLFDLDAGDWDRAALDRAGLDGALLPPATGQCALLGRWEGIPVACAIGDNQASFIGGVRDMENGLLVNMGTGGQVSALAGQTAALENCERRPLGEGRFILAGSSLCGGRAYALLEGFLRSCAALAGCSVPSLYEAMNRAALPALDLADLWQVDTRFCGARRQPHLRGSFQGVGADNFDAAHLLGGALLGMARELRDLYGEMLAAGAPAAGQMVGSGNALRRNPALRLAFERTFQLPMVIPAHLEEAAFGAALFALTASGLAPTLAQAQRLIAYQAPAPEAG